MRRFARKTVPPSALLTSLALTAIALPVGVAFASDESRAPRTTAPAGAAPRQGALPDPLSPAERRNLLADARTRQEATAKALDLGTDEALVARSVQKDADGTLHTRYERTFAKLPVLGGDLVVHTAPEGTTESVTKATDVPITVDSTTPGRSAANAKGSALNLAGAEDIEAPKADSVHKVVWAASGRPALAWETVVGGVQHDGTPSEMHVITDARTGKELFAYQAVRNGTGHSQYSGRVTIGTGHTDEGYTLTDRTRGGHSTYDMAHGSDDTGTGKPFTDADDTWGDGTPASPQTAGVDAHYGAQLAWDYFKKVHERNGIRNDGVAANSRVHFGDGYANAFWWNGCFCMTYGDGKGNTKPLTQIDVAAHELTHGITENTAGLRYSDEAGGLNEATSDIMAAAVEFWADNPADPGDYLVAEKADVNGDGTPARSMDRPSRDGSSADFWYRGVGDLDVHDSSGIGNHWFYLASEGSGSKTINGVRYDSPTHDGRSVTPIGRAAASLIWYRALTTYMTSGTDYAAARDATLRAAADLYGRASATYLNTAAAWAAVNVGRRVEGALVHNPGAQNSLLDTPVKLRIQAASTNPGPVRHEATGLPPGVTVNASTGLISGTPTAETTSEVTLTVTDSTGATDSTRFTWRVRSFPNVFQNDDDVHIPDWASPVSSDIDVTGVPGHAPKDLRVDIDIKHPYRGDLTVDLVAPDGTSHRLKESTTADRGVNLIASYPVDASGETANGTWKLRVQDVVGGDTGYIDHWRLTF